MQHSQHGAEISEKADISELVETLGRVPQHDKYVFFKRKFDSDPNVSLYNLPRGTVIMLRRAQRMTENDLFESVYLEYQQFIRPYFEQLAIQEPVEGGFNVFQEKEILDQKVRQEVVERLAWIHSLLDRIKAQKARWRKLRAKRRQ